MTHPTVFQHVRIFDVARVLPADTLVIQESTIVALGSDLALPTGATVIDGTGQTLLPGLIDAHTHIFGSALQQALIFGVTTELDMLTDWHLAKRLREQGGITSGCEEIDARARRIKTRLLVVATFYVSHVAKALKEEYFLNSLMTYIQSHERASLLQVLLVQSGSKNGTRYGAKERKAPYLF